MSVTPEEAYEFLKIPFGSPESEVKKAWTALVKVYKPGKNKDLDPALFRKLNESKKVALEYLKKKDLSTDSKNVNAKKAELEQARKKHTELEQKLKAYQTELPKLEATKKTLIEKVFQLESKGTPSLSPKEIKQFETEKERLLELIDVEERKRKELEKTRNRIRDDVRELESERMNESSSTSHRPKTTGKKAKSADIKKALSLLGLKDGATEEDITNAVAQKTFEYGPVFYSPAESEKKLVEVNNARDLLLSNLPL